MERILDSYSPRSLDFGIGKGCKDKWQIVSQTRIRKNEFLLTPIQGALDREAGNFCFGSGVQPGRESYVQADRFF